MDHEGLFPNHIRWFLKQKGYRQEDLAEFLGISRAGLSLYVNGRTPVPSSPENQRERIARFLGVAEELIFPIVMPPASQLSTDPTQNVVAQKVKSILSLVDAARGKSAYIDKYYHILTLEIAIMDKTLTLLSTPGMRMTRRNFLLALGALPLPLVLPHTYPTDAVIEEYLPVAMARVGAATQLMKGSDFFLAHTLLDEVLPTLSEIVKVNSRYQEGAASLLASIYRSFALISGHEDHSGALGFHARIQHYKKAVEYAELVPQKGQLVLLLTKIAVTYAYYLGDPKSALPYLAQAEPMVSSVPGEVQSDYFGNRALVAAQMNQPADAIRFIDQAYLVHPSYLPEDALTSSPVWQYEGWSKWALFQHTHDPLLLEQAMNAYLSCEKEAKLSRRGQVSLINNLAQTALDLGDIELFEKYFMSGLVGSVELASGMRKSEVKGLYQRALIKWGKEGKILALSEPMHTLG